MRWRPGRKMPARSFVEDLERRLVAVQAKLALELDGRDAWRMARNEVGGPEPDRQRRAGPLHDRAGGQRIIPLTLAAPQNLQPVGEAVGLAGFAAPSADEPVAPADGFKISSAKPYRQETGVGTRAVSPERADPRGARQRRA